MTIRLIREVATNVMTPHRAHFDQQIDQLTKRVDEISKKVELTTATKQRKRLNFFQALQVVSIVVGIAQITSIVFHHWKSRSLPPSPPPVDYDSVNTGGDS